MFLFLIGYNVNAESMYEEEWYIEYEEGKEYAKRTHLLSETVI